MLPVGKTQNKYTLVDSEESREEGEVRNDIIPFHRSYKRNTLYEINNKTVLIGYNNMPNMKEYTNIGKIKKNLKKQHPELVAGEEIIEQSRSWFNNQKFLEIFTEDVKINLVKKQGEIPMVQKVEESGDDYKIEFIKEYEIKENYKQFIKNIYNNGNINDNIFNKIDIYGLLKRDTTTTIIISDQYIDMYNINKTYLHIKCINNYIIFDKMYFSNIDFNQYYTYLLNSSDLSDKYTNIRVYKISQGDRSVRLIIYSNGTYSDPNYTEKRRVWGNGVDCNKNSCAVQKDKLTLVEHEYPLYKTDILNKIVGNIQNIKKGDKYAMNDHKIYKLGAVGEMIEYKEMDMSKLIGDNKIGY